ncbi:MAG: GTPase Era [Gammaproteobacteria bacterium]|nr:GTPase Era [Gammaproteobacteria bacterium]
MHMTFHCGYVAIVGRPNVGKSTLLNRAMGQKLSITSRKPQTTRHSILGVKTTDQAQILYIDTPGLHVNAAKAMNRYMNKTALNTLNDVDVVAWLVNPRIWTDDEQFMLKVMSSIKVPVVLVINKIDEMANKNELLPEIEALSKKREFNDVVPLSAKKDINIDAFEKAIIQYLPEKEALFPDDQLTDRSARFLASEIIREKLMRRVGDEVPYSMTVEIEQFGEEKGITHIHALIWVERDGQKAIVVGKGGEVLKEVGRSARLDMEELFGCKVFLKLWVKVKSGWSDNLRALQSLGYKD